MDITAVLEKAVFQFVLDLVFLVPKERHVVILNDPNAQDA
jgi:hypothetical protein